MVASRFQMPKGLSEKVAVPPFPILQFSVEEYHRLVDAGILKSGDPFELLNGWITPKMTINPPHNKAVRLLNRHFNRLLGEEWIIQVQGPITIRPSSEPEPDLVIAYGPEEKCKGNPDAKDVVLVVEVADSSPETDRGSKIAIYVRARIPVYWIVNLIDGWVEVYTLPRLGRKPTYRRHRDFASEEFVPVILNGKTAGEIRVKDILP